MPNKRACSLRRHTHRGYTPHETTSPILFISPSQSKNPLALVKIQILKPSGWVIPKQLLHLCPYLFMFVSTQTWRNILKMCFLDNSRSHRCWVFQIFMIYWRLSEPKLRHGKCHKHASIACGQFLGKLWTSFYKQQFSQKLSTKNACMLVTFSMSDLIDQQILQTLNQFSTLRSKTSFTANIWYGTAIIETIRKNGEEKIAPPHFFHLLP